MKIIGQILLIVLCSLPTMAVLASAAPAPIVLADDGFDWAAGDDEELADFEDDFINEAPVIHDPLETINRGIFWFNDRLYFLLLKPLARGLRLLPEPIRQGIGNVFVNLEAPIRAGNALLQLKFKATAQEIMRFVVNSTLGIGGIFDIATKGGMPIHHEDFGQTLGHYGIGPGVYLVLPILGPSSLRDAAGETVDTFLDPIYLHTDTNRDLLAVKSVKTVNQLSLDRDTYEEVKRNAIDPYAFIKNTYIQHRARLIEQ